MTFLDHCYVVKGILQDPGGIRFDGAILERYTNAAIRRVERAIGKTQKRAFFDLVSGQQEYPLGSGILRVITVEIIPANAARSSRVRPLQEVDLADIPSDPGGNHDPDRYAINIAGGVNQNQFELIFYPKPVRSTDNAIVVTYDGDFTVDTELPFPETFDLVLQRLTAAGCLSEEDDETSIKKSEYLKGLAERELSDLSWMGSLSDVNNIVRSFP